MIEDFDLISSRTITGRTLTVGEWLRSFAGVEEQACSVGGIDAIPGHAEADVLAILLLGGPSHPDDVVGPNTLTLQRLC
jgi:hypothetical protein